MKMFDALMRAGVGIADRLYRYRHYDAWYNAVTGFGTRRDKTTYGRAVDAPILTLEELDALYNHNDMAARIVDIVPDDVYSQGFSVETGYSDLDEIMADKFDQLAVAERCADAMRWGRAFGGGALLIGADDGRDASLPLMIERADDIRYLYDIDRRVLTPNTYYMEYGHPSYGKPETYLVWNEHALGGDQVVVHESRLIMFGGAPTTRHERIRNQGWDLSVLQRPHEILRQFDTGWKSVEILLTDAHQTVLKMSGLADIISHPNGMEAISKRATITDMYRSVIRAVVVDADANESLERMSVSFEAIPQTLDKIMLRMSAAADVPVTRLMGQSPAGLSATGESDLRWHYGRMESERTRRQEPRIRKLAMLWLQTRAGQEAAGGRTVKSITIKWPSLWSESPLNDAQRRKLIAEADAIRINSQVLTPDEVALVRGRIDGWDKDIVLTDEAIKAREKALQFDLEEIASGERTMTVDGATANQSTNTSAPTEDSAESGTES